MNKSAAMIPPDGCETRCPRSRVGRMSFKRKRERHRAAKRASAEAKACRTGGSKRSGNDRGSLRPVTRYVILKEYPNKDDARVDDRCTRIRRQMNNFQRDGSAGPQVGRAFEERVCKVHAARGLPQSPHKVPCGLDTVQKRAPIWDRRTRSSWSANPGWTSGGNVPGALNEPWMVFYFLAPSDYRKIFFIERSVRPGLPATRTTRT